MAGEVCSDLIFERVLQALDAIPSLMLLDRDRSHVHMYTILNVIVHR